MQEVRFAQGQSPPERAFPALRRPSLRVVLLTLTSLTVLTGIVLFFRPGQECHANQAGAPAPSAKAPVAASGSPAPLPVDVVVLEPTTLETRIPATGTLLPRETVTIVSELSRRLTRIRAEEGQLVKKGAVLFELDSSDLIAEQKRLNVQQKLADRNAARQEELLKEAVTSEAEADAARSTVLELEASRNIIAVTLQKTTIVAPFDGMLGLRQVSLGTWVTPATPLITLSDVSELKIDFRIPERHARAIDIGAAFLVTLDGDEKTYSGRVTATEPSIDESSRSLLVRGVLHSEGQLIPGAFAKVELPVVQKDALMVPPIAIIPGISGRSVYVERDGVARLIPVQLGVRTQDRVQVEKGLSAGDRVIVSNLLRLRDGAQVTSGAAE